jgi:hypothetical protein
MAASSEVPDIFGTLTNAVGLNKLWQTDEQADSEKRKSDQADRSSQEEHQQTNGKGKEPNLDHDEEIHGVPRPPTSSPSTAPKKGYEWPMPSTLNSNQDKVKYGSEPTRDTNAEPPQDTEKQPANEEDESQSKPSFIGSLIPFLTQQKASPAQSPAADTAQATSSDKEFPFTRPRPHSASSQQKFDRPPKQRQYTMPVQGRPETPDSKAKSAARSRWATAARGLRFPLRRTKQDNKEQRTRGTEVITTLAAGAPAANILASHMAFDEHSRHRVPLIVDLLKVHPAILC